MTRGFRFIHAADLHLDSPFRGLSGLPDALRERVKASTFTALERLVDLAVREQVDFIVVSGDIYDAKDRSLRAQLRFQQALETLAGHGVPAFVVHGNHDPLHDGYSAKLRWPDTVKVFGSDAVESVIVRGRDGEPVARVSGISFGRSAVTDNLTPGYVRHNDGLYHIGILHTNVDGDAGHDNYAPCSLRDLTGGRVDYWALGHIHSRRVLHERPWVVYPGNLQGRHVRETGPRGCYVVDVAAGGETQLRFQPLDDVRWQVRELSIAGLETEQQLKDALEEELEAACAAADGRAVLARLSLTGRGPLHAVMRRGEWLAGLVSALRESGGEAVWIESIEDRTGAAVSREDLVAKPGFLGDLLRLASEAGESPERLSAFAEEALAPLIGQPQLAALLSELGPEEWAAWLQEAEELAIDLLADGGGAETGWSE
ncbi:metallophosphoesterase family protein [Paenibacillus oleatilyticus]|uniref:metallophosphoesterase family protein n=1 Tax=Paenibacillus oleatilyticus TaxID=2594886 RepID=UPI001C1F54E4|nr:DNA repair exonuclease [Paenibacillus oleatilyticus]MBU7321046.1 DNA repair exonuclease [Paenibacillus oleatilyticus]